MHTIRIFLDIQGRWRWNLKSPNGRKIATSGESFSRRDSAVRAANMIAGLLRDGAVVVK